MPAVRKIPNRWGFFHICRYKGLVQTKQAGGGPSGQQHVQKIETAHVVVSLYCAFQGDAVADGGGHSAAQDAADGDDGAVDGKVVGVNGCHGKADKGRDADVIDGVTAGTPDFAQHQSVHQLFQFGKLGVADAAPAYVLRV